MLYHTIEKLRYHFSVSYHDHQSFASEFREITNISIPRNLTAPMLSQDKVVMVDHLHFRQASAMTNPGQRCFILLG